MELGLYSSVNRFYLELDPPDPLGFFVDFPEIGGCFCIIYLFCDCCFASLLFGLEPRELM